jgi:hypothetical protein
MQANRYFIANRAAEQIASRRARAALDPAVGSRQESLALIGEMLSLCGWDAHLMPPDDAILEGEALTYADAAGQPFLLVRPEGLDAPEPLTPVLDVAARNGFRWVIATDLVHWKVASVADRLPHNLVDFPRSPDSETLLTALDASSDVEAGLAEFVSVAPVFADHLAHGLRFIESRVDDFAAMISAEEGRAVSPAWVLRTLRSTPLSTNMPNATSGGARKTLTREFRNRGSSGPQVAEHEMEAVVADEADFAPFFENVFGIAPEEVACLAAAYRLECDTLGIPLPIGESDALCAFLQVWSGPAVPRGTPRRASRP